MSEEEEISRILYLMGEEGKSTMHGAVVSPVFQTTNFAFPTVSDYRKAMANEKDTSLYTRGNNPTVRLVEKKLAALQGTEDALLFGSGSAAIAAGVITLVSSGDHVICVRSAYSWTLKLLNPLLDRFDVSHTTVDGRSLDHIISARTASTRLLILESPNSFLFEMQDLKAAIYWAKSQGIKVLVDNSYGTPLNRYSAICGADLIAHSATKFIGGHSDVVAGLLCGSNALMAEVFKGAYMTLGAALAPMNAWLLMRGMRTMPLRMAHSARTCHEVVDFLKKQSWVERVSWPFDQDYPQRDLAREQFNTEVSMFSVVVKYQVEKQLEDFCDSMRVLQIAASWGGYESLIVPAVAFDNPLWPRGLMRVYIGLESPELLIDDLKQAATKAGL